MAKIGLGDLTRVAVIQQAGDGLYTDDSQEMRLDFADVGGTNYKPIYIGKAFSGAATSAGVWLIQKLTWTDVGGGTYKPTRIQVLIGVWDNRASLGW